MHSVVSLALSALLVAHSVFGCCLHHDHAWCVRADESQNVAANHDSCCHHGPPATHSTETPDEHRDCPSDCDRLALPASAHSSPTDLRWQSLPVSSASVGDDSLQFSSADAASTSHNVHRTLPLRAHLLLRVLIL